MKLSGLLPAVLILSGFLGAPGFATAQTLADTARQLAIQVAPLAGPEPLTLSVRGLFADDEQADELKQVRSAFETELRGRGIRLVDTATAAQIRLTLSASGKGLLLIAEVQRGADRQVLLSDWTRPPMTVTAASTSVSLTRRLLWQQARPILAVALLLNPRGLLILDSGGVTFISGNTSQTVPVQPPRAWPRDLRGRLSVGGSAFQASLPGMLCRGSVQPALGMECHSSDEPWPIDSAGTLAGLTTYASERNYFTGRLVTSGGAARGLPPFFSAGRLERSAETLWLLAGLDGRTRLYDSGFQVAGVVENWGSDLAVVSSTCGAGRQVLATRPTESGSPDAVQAFEISGHDAVPVSPTIEFPGPVTALWSAASGGATVVSFDPATGLYAAFSLAIACGS